MTNMKKLVAICVLISSPALAGEITGSGQWTPVHDYVANSICSFSGRNDDTSGPSALVQSYGQIVAAFGQPAPNMRPGSACNGHTGVLS